MYHYLRKYLVRSPGKTFNSTWAVFFFLLTCHLIWASINGLGGRGQKLQKTVFGNNIFANNFRTKKASGIIWAPSCSSPQGASKHIHGDFERSGSLFDLRSRSHVDLNRSCCISVDASRQDRHNDTTPMSVALFNRELWTCWWPRLTTDDLYEGHRPKFATGSSTLVLYNSIDDKMTESDAYRRNLAFLPLPYNGEVTKLTWPYFTEIRNTRHGFCSY